MEAEETMELRDLPVDTRNYTIVDNVTGKPIEQSKYSLTIDPEVIGKLNTLKKVNEEKIRQATLKGQYKDSTLVDTFTPEDNSVFTPVFEGDYIQAQDFNATPEPTEVQAEETVEEEKPEAYAPEVLQQDTILERVVARDPSTIQTEDLQTSENADENTDTNVEDNGTSENPENPSQPVDNSTFTPPTTGLQQASEQIVKIDAEKLGPAIRPPKGGRSKDHKVNLDKMEIKEAKGYAWLGYLLFFLPLLINRKNRFARIHANEGLELNIMEILGVLLILPYFLLKNVPVIWVTVEFVAVLVGVVLLGMCALTIIPMMICAMCGLQFQTPWLWKKRIIKISETRE